MPATTVTEHIDKAIGKIDKSKAIDHWDRNLVPDLIAAIEEYLDANNDDPTPFVWTATADDILEKVRRGRVVLNRIAG